MCGFAYQLPRAPCFIQWRYFFILFFTAISAKPIGAVSRW